MRQKALLAISLLIIALLIMPVLLVDAQVDLDANRGRFTTRFSVQRGGTQVVEVIIRGYDAINLTISPTIDPVEVIVRDPEDRIISRETVITQRRITVNVETKGLWKIIVYYTPATATATSQDVYIDIAGIVYVGFTPSPARTTPSQGPGAVLPWEFIGIIGGGVLAVIIVAIAVLSLRKKPKPAPQPAPQPPPAPPSVVKSEETVVMERAPGAKETEMILAAFELPDGKILPVTSPRQIFGRADFEKYVPADMLKYVSRRHFMIYLEPGGFFIEDLGSANGTIVNGSDIRGKGKVPLKSGDIIEVGGVVKLRFKAGA